MTPQEQFAESIREGYTFKGDYITLGGAMYNRECIPGAQVRIPLGTLNRHGLIAGATGTGKTKTLQIIAEQLSLKGVPSLLMDVKGDLSGIAMPGQSNTRIEERHQLIDLPFIPGGSPVEFLSLSGEKGARLRATVTEFGPVLFSRMLDLTEAQSGIVSIVFKYCDDHNLPLLDLRDLRKVINYFMNEGKDEIRQVYGTLSSASAGSVLRKLVELEQQGAEVFFGERSFEVDDLCGIDDRGRGLVSIIRLTDIQDRPKLFSTFMLQILAEIYATFPEEGDLDQPKLTLFIDEAHLVFSQATKALLDQLEIIIKLIRSKGVGIFFITQNPVDIPNAILSQLGLKVQHALRAFTAKDREAIRLASRNFPDTPYYDIASMLTQLGTGEALVAALNEKGIPTPLVHTLLRAPRSRMEVLTPVEIDQIVARSKWIPKYNGVIHRESAYDILKKKIEFAREAEQQEQRRREQEKARLPKSSPSRGARRKSVVEQVLNSPASREMGRTLARELTRGLLSVLGVSGNATRKRGR
jgi:DNA helicase HerA-like ATPase